MKILIPGLAAVALALSACGGEGDDALGDNAADAAEMQAENLEDMAANAPEPVAENLEDQADAIEEQGEEREEQIDESDVDADALNGQ